MKIINVKDPVWSCNEKVAIDCTILVEQFPDLELPFRASPTDFEEHGRNLFSDIVAGKYGAIADYVAPQFEPVTVTPPSNEIPQSIL